MRTPIVAANWKMNKTVGQAVDLAAEIKRGTAAFEGVEVVLCPPFTALKSVGDLVRFSRIRLGAQDVHWEADGAFTGEISTGMLRDLDCSYVIVGHSERRTHFGDTDEQVNRKLRAALAAGLNPILCVGETLAQRESGRAEEIVGRQVTAALEGVDEGLSRVVIAYEPVWAIGTGKTATAREAQAAQAYIRSRVRERAGEARAEALRIQYGGSVKPENAREIFAQPDVDGGLIGGASLAADSFCAIVETAVPD